MNEEIKKPLEDLFTSGKDAIRNAVKSSDESKAFFERLSDKISDFTGQTTVENKELTYNKDYDPEAENRS